jgi:Rrf2 family protein
VRISTRGRYSLEALLYLGLLQSRSVTEQEPVFSSTHAVAEATGIWERYLEQLFIPLRIVGFIEGVRGPRGGYFLPKPAGKISVGAVFRCVEGPMEIVECVDATLCPKVEQCQSRHTWKELYDEINTTINSLTLADLAAAYRRDNQRRSL